MDMKRCVYQTRRLGAYITDLNVQLNYLHRYAGRVVVITTNIHTAHFGE